MPVKNIFTTMGSTSGLTSFVALLLAGCLPDDNDRVLGAATALLVVAVRTARPMPRAGYTQEILQLHN